MTRLAGFVRIAMRSSVANRGCVHSIEAARWIVVEWKPSTMLRVGGPLSPTTVKAALRNVGSPTDGEPHP